MIECSVIKNLLYKEVKIEVMAKDISCQMKKRIIFFVVVLFLLCAGGILNNKRHKKYKEHYQDDWAIYNYGQVVEQKGIKGIDINIIPILDDAKGKEEVIVGVVDTGVDINCNIFNKNTLMNGWDFYNDDDSIYDEYIHDYHGTYICTTIARVAPRIAILPVKFMEGTSGSVEDAIEGIEFAIKQGAKIINCSWNFQEYSDELYNIMKNHTDILFVCAAGNYSVDIDETSMYPCSYQLDNMINVLAIDNVGQVHATSGYGKESIDIGAPGESVKVFLPENEELYVDGTSVAAAFVSGIAALMLSENLELTPNEVKNIMISTARPIEVLSMKCVSGGIIDACAAINYLREE